MSVVNNFFGHLRTITKHRHMVIKHCKKAGILWQGLRHDLSKYSPTEFIPGVKYYTGTKSPNEGERIDKGYSVAWLHHKGRNKHHFEHWVDYSVNDGEHVIMGAQMPRKYVAEMVMDRIAASRTYQGKAYTDASPLQYFERANETKMLHPQTRRELRYLLTMLKDRGEKETFRFIRQVVLKGKDFAPEEITPPNP